MFTAVVSEVRGHRGYLRHAGRDVLSFTREDCEPALQRRWANLVLSVVEYDVEELPEGGIRITNVRRRD